MGIAFRDISALAAARRRGTTFESEKKKGPTSPAEKTTDPNISTALDALRAVLPATLITFCSTAVILLQNAANAAGADGRAADISGLTKSLGAGTPALEKAVKALTAEPAGYATWRVIFAVVWLVFVAIYGFRTARSSPRRTSRSARSFSSRSSRRRHSSPGHSRALETFLAAYLNATDLAFTTILIAFVGAGGLWVVSETALKRKARDAS